MFSSRQRKSHADDKRSEADRGMSKRVLTRFPTVALWGQPSRQTAVTLAALLRAGVRVTALVLARSRHHAQSPGIDVPVVPWHEDPSTLARRSGIPIVVLEEKYQLQTLPAGAVPEADTAVVSCFPWKLPSQVLERYPLGMYNLHPSLLPAYPGPEPLFWHYRDGRLRTGVTLHRVTDAVDAGPIIGRVSCTLPLAFPGNRLEAWLAWYGCGILLRHWQNDTAEVEATHPRETVRWARVPAIGDRTIDTGWQPWRVAHFLAGVLPLGFDVYIADQSNQLWQVKRFLAWTQQPLVPDFDGRRISLRFGRSWITVEATSVHSAERLRRNALRQ